MGLFRDKQEYTPRKTPTVELPISAVNMKTVMDGCDDFVSNEIKVHGSDALTLLFCHFDGFVDSTRIGNHVLGPLYENEAFQNAETYDEVINLMTGGGVYSASVALREDMDTVLEDILSGCCAFIFDEKECAVTVNVRGVEKRGISEPTNENAVKGAKDAFVENIRTNTALIRNRIRNTDLKINEIKVGRKTLTKAAVLYMDGLCDAALPQETLRRLQEIDVDKVLNASGLEEYITDKRNSVFPQLLSTERSDKLCAGLMEGQVAILVDGLPHGYLLPAVFTHFMRAQDDYAQHYLLASTLRFLRYCALGISLLLPAFYLAVATFHQEMLPTKLALSIADLKKDVPFDSMIEVLLMMLAFEILLEAGIRLPASIGPAISIVGALVVGQEAVEAKLASPTVVIVVALMGIAGFTLPNQDLAGAIRIWRYLLVLLAGLSGLFGLTAGIVILICHLADIESFGVSYLSPAGAADSRNLLTDTFVRLPLWVMKWRDGALRVLDRRNQK